MATYKVQTRNGCNKYKENLEVYCNKLQKHNNELLFLIENYTGKSLKSDDDLLKIRGIILTISGEIKRLPKNLIVSDEFEN